MMDSKRHGVSDFPPDPLKATLDAVLKPFVGCPNDACTRAAIQSAVAAFLAPLGEGREFLVQGEGDALAVNVMPELPMTEATFTKLVGRAPVNDDLDRVNCPTIGGFGHTLCGWCLVHYGPRFQCGCVPGVR